MLMIVRLLLGRRNFHGNRPLQKIVPFVLADIGEGITEVELLEWHIKEGATVRQFDKIAEVQSDKATVEITSRFDGKIKKLHYQKGSMARVGTPLIDIEVDGAEERHSVDTDLTGERVNNENKISERQSSSPESANAPVTPTTEPANVKAMPAVRALAKSLGIDISLIKGTGRSGQVTKENVLSYSQQQNITESTLMGSVHAPGFFEKVPLHAFQRAMIKSMQIALTIPHFGYHDEMNINQLAALRSSLKEHIEREYGVRITPMAFYIKALSLALKDFPSLNAHYDDKENVIKRFPSHNISMAVDTDHGLAVPVLKGVQTHSIVELAREISRLSGAARANKLTSNDLSHGTITISNIGSVGGTTANPVIVAPQVAIVALGKAQILPRFDQNMHVAPQTILPISWSADHRVIDGATVAKLTQKWKFYLESPASLLLHLTKP